MDENLNLDSNTNSNTSNNINNSIDNQINNNIQKTKPEKKHRFTKFLFYIMAVLLLATTVMCSLITYKIYTKNDVTSSNMHNTNEPEASDQAVSNDMVLPENHTLISNDALLKMQNEAFLNGQNDLLSSLKNMMEGGETTLKALRTLYPNYLIYNQTGGYVFTDINTSLLMNDYDKNNFKITEDKNGIPTNVEYYKDNNLASYKGIDVSTHNGTIDWAKVKADGVDFAMLRAGVRGYGTTGKLSSDDTFSVNAKGATDNDIAIGAYIFSEAITTEEAIEEADLILSLIEPYEITYPIVIDVEEIHNDDGRNEALTPSELTDIVLVFCDKIKEAGYTPMIYCNLKGFIGMLEFERLEGIEKWYAYYGNELYFPYDVSMWQYSSTGKVNGIKGDVDLNISFKNYK